MKATGIIRRVDELGRIVIPKEIRKTLRMKEGSPIEIFMNDTGGIVLKKYSPLSELNDFAKEAVESIFMSVEHSTLLCDKDEILQVAGTNKTDYINKAISFEIEKIIADRKVTLSNKKEDATIYKLIKEDVNDYTSQIIAPINCSGDTLGAIIIFSKDLNTTLTLSEVKVATTMANFLAKRME
ncbi:MAG: stage V sporulation T C-terminal domain-containing protein [Clostridia bacterium]|nr:stage V sporulation T C-terminal domain-containing protein [Clostridia bacterium]